MINESIMNWKLNIRNKISLGFFCLVIILLATVLMTVTKLDTINEFIVKLERNQLPLFEHVTNLNTMLQKSIADLRGYALTGDKQFQLQQQADWQQVSREIIQVNALISNTNDKNFDNRWNESKILLNKLNEYQNDTVSLINNKASPQEINKLLFTTTTPVLNKLQDKLSDIDNHTSNEIGLSGLIRKTVSSSAKTLKHDLSNLLTRQWVLLAVGLIAALIISLTTARNISSPILYAIDIAKRIAKGERDIEINSTNHDETALLLSALNEMQDAIFLAEGKLKDSENKVQNLLANLEDRIRIYRNFIEKITHGDLREQLMLSGSDDLSKLGEHLNSMTSSLNKIAKQILAGTNEMSTGISQLENTASAQAASANQQAASVTEVTSVIEEIKVTSMQTLEKASKLGQSAEQTHDQGEKGKQAIVETIRGMHSLQEKMSQIANTILSLSDKTQQVGEITEAVSGLAKQSKLLALNASIEAAKAGEAGKGFAVVANEVKALAEESQLATDRVRKVLQEIRQTAERAVIVTEEGSKGVVSSLEQVEKTESIINTLGEVIQLSSMASQQIVAAVRQESAGIDQVVVSMNEIDKVTKQFTAATEQTKQSSLSLAKVALALKNSVSLYKTTDIEK